MNPSGIGNLFPDKFIEHHSEKADVVRIAGAALYRIHVMAPDIPAIHATGINRNVSDVCSEFGKVGFKCMAIPLLDAPPWSTKTMGDGLP
ncbi:MAG: hypothetical protein ACK5YO_01630 [Planctomyces sp.]|jgi:hypothetical protein